VLESEKAFLVKKTNRFGVALYQKLAARPGNVLFSPLGVASALALLDAGARKRTAKQIENSLGWKLSAVRVRATYATLLAGSERGGFVDACRLSGPGRFSDQFRQEVEQRFGAELETVAAGSESTLAGWLREHGVTDDRVPEPTARPGLALALVTSLRAGWRWPFTPERTQPAPFRGQSDVATMHQTMTVPVGKVGEVTLLELPYHDPRFALDLLVPETDGGFGVLEKSLSAEYLESLFAATKLETVELSLPRFTLAAAPDLGRELGALGMRDLLGPTADWSGLSPGKGTRLAALLHHARLSVDERGSDAAGGKGSRPSAGQAPRALAVDRPFLVVVRDVLAGTVLLLGRVVAPVAPRSGT
jgi:serpin B